MAKVIDLTGQQFGKLQVLKRSSSNKYGKACWLCKCSCGNPNLKNIVGSDLRSGNIKSCGKCSHYEIIGKKFGHLTVLEFDIETTKEHLNKNPYYKCQCDCEKHTIVSVRLDALQRGSPSSCGCQTHEKLSKAFTKDLTNQIFGNIQALYPTEKRTSGGNVIWHVKCLLCGVEYDLGTDHLRENNSQSCGCIKSYGENKIIKILQENNIKFEKEKTFNDCINIETQAKLRYDFYLPDYNRLIEFDGQQHYFYTGFGWDTEKQFKKTKRNDKIKNDYAKFRDIDLIRIPYVEKDITIETLLGNKYLV